MLAKFSEHNSNFTKFYGKYIQSSGWESNLQGECSTCFTSWRFHGNGSAYEGQILNNHSKDPCSLVGAIFGGYTIV